MAKSNIEFVLKRHISWYLSVIPYCERNDCSFAFSKKDRWGNCLSSPTTTAFLALNKIGKQLAISHWEASSMITTSNNPGFIGSEPETAYVVTHQQGNASRSGLKSSVSRSLFWRFFFLSTSDFECTNNLCLFTGSCIKPFKACLRLHFNILIASRFCFFFMFLICSERTWILPVAWISVSIFLALQTSFANSNSLLKINKFSLLTSKLFILSDFFKFPIADIFFKLLQKPAFSRFSLSDLIELSTRLISSSFRTCFINLGLAYWGFWRLISPFTPVHSSSSLIIFSDFFSKSDMAFKRFSMSETSQRIVFSAPSSRSTLLANRSWSCIDSSLW